LPGLDTVPAMVSRRALLASVGLAGVGGLGYGLVESGVLPGQSRLDRALGRCDVSTPAAAPAGPVVRGVFASLRRRRDVSYTIGYPYGARTGDPVPVCLVLHGYGETSANLGPPAPFALAAMDGGNGYWHPHATDDPLGALLDEFVPLLAQRGLDTDRIAVLGRSMGGYGALLAGLSRPFAAVVAGSPAIWRSYDEARAVNAGAFDSAAEWARYDVFARATELRGRRLRIDCGESDPFAPAVRALRDRLPDPSSVRLAKGCHDGAFWNHVAPEQYRFIAASIAT
jgi:hypothetical protein